MADVSITVAELLKGTTAMTKQGIAGATVTQGETLYIDTANSNVLKLAKASGTALEATCCGMALNAALSGQPILYAYKGLVTLGATAAAAEGTIMVLSTTAGAITVDAVASTEYTTTMGVINGSDQIDLNIVVSGQQVA